VRHDANLMYVSALEDGGDAIDASFRLGRGCHHGGDAGGFTSAASGHHNLLSLLHGHDSQQEDVSAEVTRWGLAGGVWGLYTNP
jgi:hypothetical protein